MGPVQVIAPTAGSIIEVLVSVGESVTLDQELILIESMKMEIPVRSPAAGTVLEIHVKAADPINNGDLVARIEADSPTRPA